jgi:putative SOS response-associated peptidase YedK
VCGRYVSTAPVAALADWFGVEEVRAEELAPSWNVAPTDPVYAVAEHGGRRRLGVLRWGLVPPGAQPGVGPRPINARSETLTARPAFREAFPRRRCLLPADGFYEWQAHPGGGRHPHFIRPRHGGLLALAGVWSASPDAGEPLRTCAIVTTTANAVVGTLHDRMPVILPARDWDVWLDPDCADVTGLAGLLVPAPDDLLELFPVSARVNSVRNNGPDLIHPAPPPPEPPATLFG